MAINLHSIHAVSTQGLLLAVTLSLIVGFGAGQYFKAGKRLPSALNINVGKPLNS